MMVTVQDPRCEYKRNPLGIDILQPRLSWKLSSDERNTMQRAYQVQVAISERDLQDEKDLLWDSGRQVTDQSIHVEYQGQSLKSHQRCYWRVRVWDENGQESGWSDLAFWEIGLLHVRDWKAKMICPDLIEDPEKSEPCPMLRKEFAIKSGTTRARLYITAHGLYEAWINGKRVGDELFTPGWTTYQKCLQYQVYDVTEGLKEGANAIGVVLGDGWYRGYTSYFCERNIYGAKLGLYMQLEITYQDGVTEFVVSDETWRASTGPIVESDIFNGEVYDARLEKPGWDGPGFDDSAWSKVSAVAFDPAILAAPIGVPVRRMEEVLPEEIINTPAGETVVDFGQNMAGWIRLKARGPRGTAITVQHGEVLDSAGNFYNKNLRMAKATDRFILKGDDKEEVFEPRFTFHGFRYVKLEGYPGEVTPDCLTGIVVHSDLDRTGEFSCSNPLVNRLHKNIIWTQKSNFLDVPTDCPQRDERMGWTGDLQVYAPTACLNMNSAPFLARWLRDLKNDQRRNGSVPLFIPDPFADKKDFVKRLLKHRSRREGDHTGLIDKLFVLFILNSSSAWGDAAVLVPWQLYLNYGDTRILESHYESMQAFLQFIEKRAAKFGSFIYVNPRKWFQKRTREHLRYYSTAGFHFGDWLAPGDGMNKSILKSKWYIPTVYYALDALILSKVAAILGREDDAAYYREMHDRIKAAFQCTRVKNNGRIWPKRQTAYVLALMADMLPDESKEKAARILADMVRDGDYQLGTGFLGTPLICQVLSRYGYADVAYELLLQEKHQWLYQVNKGATTIWEHWDAIREDGSFQSERMLSFNHYAYGAIGAWLYQGIAGINVDEARPGYKHIIIEPLPSEKLMYARASYNSIHGLIRSEWSLPENNQLIIQVEIPANASAKVIIPKQYSKQVLEDGNAITLKNGAVEIGSGIYEFYCTA